MLLFLLLILLLLCLVLLLLLLVLHPLPPRSQPTPEQRSIKRKIATERLLTPLLHVWAPVWQYKWWKVNMWYTMYDLVIHSKLVAGSTPCSTTPWWRKWTSATLWATEPRRHLQQALDMLPTPHPTPTQVNLQKYIYNWVELLNNCHFNYDSRGKSETI